MAISIGIIFIALASIAHTLPTPIKIGAIFHDGEEANYEAMKKALTTINEENVAPSFKLEPIIKWVNSSTDSFKTSLAACSLVEEGVAAIFGPGNPHTRNIVSSITSKFQIPHIEYSYRRMDDVEAAYNTVRAYPDGEKISNALADMLDAMSWRQFTILYETDDGLSRLQKLLWKHGPKDSPVTVRQMKPTYEKYSSEPNYRPLLKEVAKSTDFNVIIDADPEHFTTIVKQMHEVKLLRDYYNYFITSLHIAHKEMLPALNGTEANVTAIQIIADESFELPTVESAVLFDSVLLFHEALEVLQARLKINGHHPLAIKPEALSCADTETKFEAGLNLTDLMREISSSGRTTGLMKFDEDGGRTFEIKFQEYRLKEVFESATWVDGALTVMRTEKDREQSVLQAIEQMHFVVTTKVGDPWIIPVTDGSLRGVPIEDMRYEGYAVDLIHEIAEICKFKYTFQLVPDKQFGIQDPDTKQWNGMIGQLLNREADLAVCDFTITKERESVVDFTMPFMNLGISILYLSPEDKEPELFSFLSPFSADVWIYMATALLAVSIMFFIQARMSPAEWLNPHPCVSDPEELENSFSFKNCLWVTVGSLMQQGSDIAPTAGSIRAIAGFWWFFVLIMVSSYTANLAAFLTAVKMGVTINNIEELAAQSKIKYGSLGKGSTAAFFRDSNVTTYQKMWQTMMDAKPSVFVSGNAEGVDRVLKGKYLYAFLMESTAIEYAVERNCNLMQVGSLLDNKGYGIALPPNSPYRTQLSLAILQLQEKGILRELKTKWWMMGSKNCTRSEADDGALTIAHVGGVFLVLGTGIIAALIVAVSEFFWNIRKVAVEQKITPREALEAELRFAVDLSQDTKPVRVSQSTSRSASSEGSSGNNQSTRAVSTARSFLRLDIIDKIDLNSKKESTPTSKSNKIKV
ncbi:glutamate receptor ionotropic, kainate 2-like [Microplitis mediator]|uniref:glutamate receptor ionotropic, kainate 2-like n=1 Tax=Microplitis mediator TaxID=375433 RepID=UPI0025529700|nr:glutamate receptor ionotropic, kainate 2-like [Microplitis mediator]